MTISLIAAISSNNVIGKDNKLPWHLPSDLKRFKEITSGHTIIMGRKTFESIGRPLPNRVNIVVTRNRDYKKEGVEVVHSIEEAVKKTKGEDEVFVIGGAEIYKQALSFASKIYLTRVKTEVEGDAYFPKLGKEWKEIECIKNKVDNENMYEYEFCTYIKS